MPVRNSSPFAGDGVYDELVASTTSLTEGRLTRQMTARAKLRPHHFMEPGVEGGGFQAVPEQRR